MLMFIKNQNHPDFQKVHSKKDPAIHDQRLYDHDHRKTQPWPHREMQK